MKTRILLAAVALAIPGTPVRDAAAEPLYIAFQWHMHQPIYWPGEDVVATAGAGRYGFDVVTVHTDRSGPYTSWPGDAIGAARAAGLGHAGAQVSFSGSLMENLDALERAGRGFSGWRDPWTVAGSWLTGEGNPAIDLVNFVYFHPLSALIAPDDLVFQIRLHRQAVQRRFPGYPASRGLFPPETAFSGRMIPALVDAGVEWAIVDNVHFDRALPDYPYAAGSNLVPPNRADQLDHADVAWVQLDGIWAPSRVSAPWGYQPHRARYVDPVTGEARGIVVVPGARYEGNEDARGGFGALNYEGVLSQLEPYNTDPAHPMLVVLHHDGDNYGGGTDSYYHSNFGNLVAWLVANPARFQLTTIQDYLDRFPPAADDVIHVEDGSWSGADNGDPEFLKWNGDPGADGYSPDRHSWAVMTAAINRVHTAAAARPAASVDEVLDGSTDLGRAWRSLLLAETSCYWYWDGSAGGVWDSHPARAANLGAAAADPILAGVGAESVPPTLYPPQRQPYNPGEIEWGTERQPEDFAVWTFAYDVSGLSRVELWYRPDDDGALDAANELYATATWCVVPMTARTLESRTDPRPLHIAEEYSATVADMGGSFVDYFVEAEDARGNVARSPIRHVWVGDGGTPGGGSGVSWYPSAPNLHDALTVVAWAAGAVHWGVNSWHEPPAEYWPSGTTPFGDGRAVDTPLAGPAADGRYTTVLGPFDGTARVDEVDFVVHYADDTWSRPDQVAAIDHEPAVLPSVEIAEPEDGAVVSGTVRLVAAAADDGAAPAVQFLVDGSPLATIAARPYEADWDTTTVAEGAHTLAARADDGAGHSAEDSASVTVRRGGTTEECTVPSTADADADGDGDADADADAPLDGLGAEDADAPFDGLGAEDADARREDGGATDAAGDGPGADGGNAGCSCRAAPAGGAGIGIALLAAIALRRRRCRTLPRPVHSAPQVRDQRVDVDVDVDADDSGTRAQVAHADAHADVHGGSPEVPRGCTEARGSAPGGG